MISPFPPNLQPPPGKAGIPAWAVMTQDAATPALQMAVDHVLAESVWAGLRPPTLRLYRWPHPAVTVGRLQRTVPAGSIRRLTGGRAIHHDDEVTLSLALAAPHPLIAPKVGDTYHTVSSAIARALASLGLGVTLSAPRRERSAGHLACFSSRQAAEPVIGVHKVAGIAQRLTAEGLFIQASIPLAPPRDPLAGNGIIGLRHFQPGLQWEPVAQALSAAFCHDLGPAPAHAHPLTPRERQRAADLADTLYHPLPGIPKK